MTKYLKYLALAAIFGCSTMQSGHYIQLKRGDTSESLSKEFKVPKWKIEHFNKGKVFSPGKWVFIPLKRGIFAHSENLEPSYFFKNNQFQWPVPSSKRLSSKFGQRWGRKHEGIDIAARKGSSIVAVESGVVIYSGNDLGGYGNLTVIGHSGGIFTIYAHAKKNFTKKGDKVHKGQVIAQVGMTGRTSGPHLHFEVRHNSKAMDPLKFLAFEN